MRIQDDVQFWAALCHTCDKFVVPYPVSVKGVSRYWPVEYHHTELPLSFYILYNVSKPGIIRVIYKHKFMCVMKVRFGEVPFTLNRHEAVDLEDVFHTKIKPLRGTSIEEVEDILVNLRLSVDLV
jgi:hypothetical protein